MLSPPVGPMQQAGGWASGLTLPPSRSAVKMWTSHCLTTASFISGQHSHFCPLCEGVLPAEAPLLRKEGGRVSWCSLCLAWGGPDGRPPSVQLTRPAEPRASVHHPAWSLAFQKLPRGGDDWPGQSRGRAQHRHGLAGHTGGEAAAAQRCLGHLGGASWRRGTRLARGGPGRYPAAAQTRQGSCSGLRGGGGAMGSAVLGVGSAERGSVPPGSVLHPVGCSPRTDAT